jgi:hypothetical protein
VCSSDLSEVVSDLVINNNNYSDKLIKKMSKAITSINNLLPDNRA